MVGLQTLDLAIGVRVPASQPKALLAHSPVLYPTIRSTNPWTTANPKRITLDSRGPESLCRLVVHAYLAPRLGRNDRIELG